MPFACALVLGACSGPGDPGATAIPASPAASATPAATAAELDAGSAATPVGVVPSDDVRLRLETVVDDIPVATAVAAPPSGSPLVITAQAGSVHAVVDGQQQAWVLDLRDRVLSGGEQGLFDVAFHPAFQRTREVFLSYTARPDGRLVVAGFRVPEGADFVADPDSRRLVLEVPQPAPRHNGGALAFGPHDDRLYVTVGDGGPSGDPHEDPQDPDGGYGAVLRIDVDGDGLPHRVGTANAPEVWVHGLRNPWRLAMDGQRDVAWVSDVGQRHREEVNRISLDATSPNLGWPVREGTRCYEADSCASDGLTPPVHEYDRDEEGGCAIIGGAVWPSGPLTGHYVYSDHCAGWLRTLAGTDDGVTMQDWTEQVQFTRPVSIDVAADEVYVADGDARVHRVVAEAS